MATDIIHVVKKGDTLDKIAKKYKFKSWKTIYDAKANAKFRKLRPDPNKIEPGDKIVIPPLPLKDIKSIYFNDMPRMSITIDANKKLIFVQQKWEYIFVLKPGSGVSKWTNKEKADFHKAADQSIWKRWSGKYKITCSGTSDFAKACKGFVFDVSFDIKKVSSSGHWKVTVTKVPKGSKSPTSSVNWSKQVIKLDTEDTKLRDLRGTGKDKDKQSPFAHEFGHAVGNATGAPSGHADEYKSSSPYKAEKESMLNIGNELKKRHADHIILMLDKMIKDTKFTVKSVG